jgi:mannose-6-phosphate isomerase
VKPQVLPPNVLRHFYAGGERIARLRGLTLESDHMPEEWLGAVTTTFDGTRGLGRLSDGTLVRDAIAADPAAWLGPGLDEPGLLVKLLDAGQRLPVHFHPGREFAREALGSPYGKTEAWLIVEAEPGAAVWVGWTRDVGLDEVRAWMREQDAAAMLTTMHELPVAAGDAIYVPAGTAHAIGEGILMVEVQEPTDFSVLLEWDGFQLSEDEGHLGLGFDRALQALDRRAAPPPATTLAPESEAFFRAERLTGGDALDPGFSVLVVLAGTGTLATEGGELAVARGTVVLLPYGAGAGELRGDVQLLRARPPAGAFPGS